LNWTQTAGATKNKKCSILDDKIGRFYRLTKSADFCTTHAVFMLADFVDRMSCGLRWARGTAVALVVVSQADVSLNTLPVSQPKTSKHWRPLN